LLRVVAMTRRQVRKTIISQAAIMGLIGIGPATIVGLALGYVINLSLLPVLGHAIEFHIDFALLIGCFIFSLVIVVAAAWMPAQRAARLQLAEALQYE
jgi:putative ABC transport system permease protein